MLPVISFIYPVDGGSILLQKVGTYLPDNTVFPYSSLW